MIPWTFFSEALGQGAGSIISNADMTKKIYFPREVLTIASVTAKLVNMLLSFVIVFLVLFVSGVGVNPRVLLWLIPVIFAEYLVALGFTLFFASITVYLRDMDGYAHVDKETNEQYYTKNIIIQKMSNHSIDNYGRQDIDDVASGDGYFITNGYAVPIRWEKSGRSSKTKYTYLDGSTVMLNDGNTYVQIQPTDETLEITE